MTSISAVVPSFRRRDALLGALPNHLALEGVDEIVVVDDGSDDGTAEAVEALENPRIRLVRHPKNRGLPAARNTGAMAARGDWVVYLEDDCGFPSDYATVLRDTAERLGADIVGAPWIHTEENLVARRAHLVPVERVELTSPVWSFPTVALETPFMPALALVRRSVFDRMGYDEGYRGNFYREETDFFVSARRAGFKVVLTPETASWQLGRHDGGCKKRFRLTYDGWAIRNTWRLLRKHGAYLRREGLLSRPVLAVLVGFVWSRASYYVLRPLRAPRWLWRRLNRRVLPP